MLTIPEKKYDVGVIVARFQVDELHQMHKQLIEFVTSRHGKTIILLGVSPLPNTRNNPLPFEARRQMIREEYPEVTVGLIKNNISDEAWSANVDSTIRDLLTLQQNVVLYGSRDSFIKCYHGKFPTIELETDTYISGSEIRLQIAKSSQYGRDWRRGAIWAAYNRYPTSFQAVDAAIYSEDGKKLLMVRKPGETKYRFCGGFVDPKTPNLETNARREVAEELHIEVSDPVYVGSANINDWRYRGEVDGVMTCLFKCTYVFGRPTPDDDICEARWFPIEELSADNVMPAHMVLLDMLKK